MRSESPSGMCTKLHTVAVSNNRDRMPRSLYHCLFAPHIYVVLRIHSIRGEPHIQRNASWEVATTASSFCNEPHQSHVLFVKVTHSTTFASWSQHYFVEIRKPSGMWTKLHTVAASNNRDHMPRSLYYCLFAPHTYGVVLHAHSIHGEPHIQHNASGEVATLV